MKWLENTAGGMGQQIMCSERSLHTWRALVRAMAAVASVAEGDSAADAPRCRFCFEGDDSEELIAPCDCSGFQKWVHLSCQQKWQAHRLLEAASRERHNYDPERFLKCEVCHARLRTARLSSEALLDLVRPESGASIVAALQSPVLLVATRTSLGDVGELPPALNMMLRIRGGHWISCVFLLYARQAGAGTDGSDCICGVNLSREIMVHDNGAITGISPSEVLSSDVIQEMLERLNTPSKDLLLVAVAAARGAGVTVRFFIGGPCARNAIVVVHEETEGSHAGSSAATSDGQVRHGVDVLEVLEAATERAQSAAAAAAAAAAGGEQQQQQQPPQRLPVVLLCLGHARWSHTQLQNEMLRGSWGINARAATGELLARAPLVHAEYVSAASGTRYVHEPRGAEED